MNKAEMVNKLSNVKTIISLINVRQDVKKTLNMNINEVIEELTKDTCSNCPAMKKVDNLADAIDQAVLISKETRTPFKVACITRPYQGDINESD